MPNAPAKRAACLLIVIGIALLVASFLSTMYALLRPEWVDAQLAHNREILAGNPMFERPTLTWIIALFGGLGLIESGLSIALGMYVLRGRHWAIVTALVLTLLRLLIVVLLALLTALAVAVERALRTEQSHAETPGVTSASIAVAIGSTIVLVVLATWLVQALRAERRASGPLSP